MELVAGHEVPFTDGVEFLRDGVIGRGATAVIAYDHEIAVMLVGTAAALGLRIPLDFSLICFNDVFPVSLLPTPLTAVSVPGREMGRVGGSHLLNSLVTQKLVATQEIRLPEDLVVRGSTAPPPAGLVRSRKRKSS